MAKTDRTEVLIKDLKNNKEYKYVTESSLRNNEPGNRLSSITLNAIGIAYVQEKLKLVEESKSPTAWRNWFISKTGIPEEGFGELGKLDKEKERWEIYQDGIKTFPEVTEQRQVEEVKIPILATPDKTLSAEDNGHIALIKSYVSKGHNKKIIVGSLSKKIGDEKAEMLYDVATKVEEIGLSF